MSSDVGSITSVTGGVTAPVALVSASAASGLSVSVDSPPALPASFQNPRIIQDPVAGYITQYISANGGQIVSQTPSATTVAYLRTGLSADGTPKHPSESVAKTA